METVWVVVVAGLMTSGVLGHGQDPAPIPPTAEATVREVYERVSFASNAQPDWDRVRALFAKEAVVVLKTSRTASTTFDLEGFVKDFVTFAERPEVKAAGFSERVIRLKATEFGDIAHVLVLYEARVLGSERPPTRGVDSFHLLRGEGSWRIVSILNDLVLPDRPPPPELRGDGEHGD